MRQGVRERSREVDQNKSIESKHLLLLHPVATLLPLNQSPDPL